MSRRLGYRGSSTGLYGMGRYGMGQLPLGPGNPSQPAPALPGSSPGPPGWPWPPWLNPPYSTDLDPTAEFNQATEYFQRVIPPEPAGPANQRTAYQTFLSPGVINLPAIGSGDTPIVSFKVPQNWDGWITQIANSFNGSGFIPGSGAIVWRLFQNGQAVKDFDNITVLLGIYSPGGGVAPLRLEDPGVPIYSDDTITLTASNVSTIAGTSQVYGFLGGKRFPRGGGWGVSWWS